MSCQCQHWLSIFTVAANCQHQISTTLPLWPHVAEATISTRLLPFQCQWPRPQLNNFYFRKFQKKKNMQHPLCHSYVLKFFLSGIWTHATTVNRGIKPELLQTELTWELKIKGKNEYLVVNVESRMASILKTKPRRANLRPILTPFTKPHTPHSQHNWITLNSLHSLWGWI